MVIALVDYGAGNLTSVRKGFAAAGADVVLARAPGDLAGASGVVVPGVGHFAATASLDEAWREAILQGVDAGRPLLRDLPRHAVAVRRQRGGARLPRAGRAGWQLQRGSTIARAH